MTTAAVMQPTFLPWLGYLDLLDRVDVFVVLDTVQLDHRSWQHRNRIRAEGGLVWVTVPIAAASKRAPILEVEIGPSDEFPARPLNLIRQAYEGTAGWDAVQQVLEPLHQPPVRLVELTVPILERLAAAVGTTTPLVRASTLDGRGRRGALLAELTAHVGADRYLTPAGSVPYLDEDRRAFDDLGVEVVVHRFEHPVYRQRFEPFLSHASSIDLLAVGGAEAVLPAVRSGRRPEVGLDAALAEAAR